MIRTKTADKNYPRDVCKRYNIRQHRLIPEYLISENPELVIIALFLIITIILCFKINAKLCLPSLNCSKFIGLHYILPLSFTILWNIISTVFIHFLNKTNNKTLSIATIIFEQNTLLICFVIGMWLHFNIKLWIPLINHHTYDNIYYRIDILVYPLVQICYSIRSYVANYLPLVDYLYLNLFIVMFFISFSVHSIFDKQHVREVILAALLLQILGALSYLIMPAVGPFIYEPGLSNLASQAQTVMWENYNQIKMCGPQWLSVNGSQHLVGGLAAMPSLHVGASWVFVYYAYKYAQYLLPAYILFFLWIVIEAIATRWHYLIDLPAGILLAMLCIWLSNSWCQTCLKGENAI